MSSLMRLLPLENCELDKPKKTSKNQKSKVLAPLPDSGDGDGPELMLFAPLPSEKSETAGKASKGKKRKAT